MNCTGGMTDALDLGQKKPLRRDLLLIDKDSKHLYHICFRVNTRLSFIRPSCLIQEGPQLPGLSCPHCDRQLWCLWYFLCGPDGQWPQDLQQSWALP